VKLQPDRKRVIGRFWNVAYPYEVAREKIEICAGASRDLDASSAHEQVDQFHSSVVFGVEGDPRQTVDGAVELGGRRAKKPVQL